MCSTPSYFDYNDRQQHETSPLLDASRKIDDQIERLLVPFHKLNNYKVLFHDVDDDTYYYFIRQISCNKESNLYCLHF